MSRRRLGHKTKQHHVEVYRDHRIVVYRLGRLSWDADVQPPNGYGLDYRVSPFKAWTAARSLGKARRKVDRDIQAEEKRYARMLLIHPDSYVAPRRHTREDAA